MPNTIRIAGKLVGPGQPAYTIAEIGINHNGEIELAKRLIQVAAAAGCKAVKFHKRTVDTVFTSADLARPFESKYGETYGDFRRGVEFDTDQFVEIDRFCRATEIAWFATCWDPDSISVIDKFNPPCYGVAPDSVTNRDLLARLREIGRPVLLSTGAAKSEELSSALKALAGIDVVLMHTASTFPANYSDLNLRAIPTLAARFDVPVGYSGCETGIAPTVAAAALGACAIERTITLDRAMWGPDQAASLGPNGINRVVRDIQLVEEALGDGVVGD